MRKYIQAIVPALALCFCQPALAQTHTGYKSWNPARDSIPVLEGQAWPRAVKAFYDRLPATAENQVRPEVWNLSRNSAGLSIRFISDAPDIIIRYCVSGHQQMPHMPATGVSGVDLYSKTIDGAWAWCAGNYAFGDTIEYHFSNLVSHDQHVPNRSYTLYLPLYNTVVWMDIQVPSASSFKPLPLRTEQPIVLYGTSIAQGGCASRPGLAWPAILSRKTDRPVINLAFSGNGRLEKEVLDMIAGIDARIFVLDCLPNLVPPGFSAADLKERLRNAIRLLQEKKPGVPILLTDHAGYTDEFTNAVRQKQYQDANNSFRTVFDSLVSAGVKNIFRLSKEEIGLDIESTVDGTHPNDIGMMRYAEAYQRKIDSILDEPQGKTSTTMPVTQRRDASMYDWETRHEAVLAYNKLRQPTTVFLGNSITHYWSGEPFSDRAAGRDSWAADFGSLNVVNMGFGWDRVENVLWRVYHGELDGIKPKQMVMMIGTNNLQINSDAEIITGLKFLIQAIQARQPAMHILLLGIFPRRDMEQRVAAFNKKLAAMPMNKEVHYADAGKLFLKPDQKLNEALFSDGLHPNEAGYGKLGAFIRQRLIW